jgi:Protein of unknown function DUF72
LDLGHELGEDGGIERSLDHREQVVLLEADVRRKALAEHVELFRPRARTDRSSKGPDLEVVGEDAGDELSSRIPATAGKAEEENPLLDPEVAFAVLAPPLVPGRPLRRRRLEYYAARFDCVELNASFYRLPAERQAELWAERTPAGFLFDVKRHRYLSHHATKPDALPKDLRERSDVGGNGHVVRDPELERELARRFRDALSPIAAEGKLGRSCCS